jgi:hypothetical protein
MAFEKGASGNPGGRPKGPSLKAELIRQLGKKGDDGRKHVDAIALALIDKAREGNIEAIKEILDRVDGRAGTDVPFGATLVHVTLSIDRHDHADADDDAITADDYGAVDAAATVSPPGNGHLLSEPLRGSGSFD